ncbi:MAG: suppressor of fused domain protein [Planctomycetaceae bacterium]|nr:suppressor of fused domain protein [Planctomycetaceae bacterium]
MVEFTQEQHEEHYKRVQKALECLLGPMHNMVGHAIIPFAIGGTVDMYYFPNGIPGTGFATMELIAPDGSGPKPNRIGTYELVSFTKHSILTVQKGRNPDDPFNKIERRLCGIMTSTGYYSRMAVLNPGETCEIPLAEDEPNACVLLDEYKPDGKPFEIGGKRHCLLLCLEIFRSEMEYAMENGSVVVLKRLKDKGFYPYSDLDRRPVC